MSRMASVDDSIYILVTVKWFSLVEEVTDAMSIPKIIESLSAAKVWS